MPKNSFSTTLDAVAGEVQPLLRSRGYRKRARTFNRDLESGLVHVVNLQAGRHALGGSTPIRSDLHGQFTVNLGVFTPEIYQAFTGDERPEWVSAADCELRMRIGKLLSPPTDLWLDLHEDLRELSAKTLGLIEDRGLPYLSRFETRREILEAWERDGDQIGTPPRGPVSMAILYSGEGEEDKAAKLLREQYASKQGHPFRQTIERVASQLAITL